MSLAISNSALDWTFTCIGLPIFVANLFAWGNPQLIESVFGWKADKSEK